MIHPYTKPSVALHTDDYLRKSLEQFGYTKLFLTYKSHAELSFLLSIHADLSKYSEELREKTNARDTLLSSDQPLSDDEKVELKRIRSAINGLEFSIDSTKVVLKKNLEKINNFCF